MNDNDSADTSVMGTKYDKKDMITSTAAFLAQGMLFIFVKNFQTIVTWFISYFLVYYLSSTEHEIGFCHLDMNAVVNAFNVTKQRVLVLDLNGTIVFKEPPGKYLKREDVGFGGMSVEPEVRLYITLITINLIIA